MPKGLEIPTEGLAATGLSAFVSYRMIDSVSRRSTRRMHDDRANLGESVIAL